MAGFNEAATFRPRNRRRSLRQAASYRRASMRPRPFGRGITDAFAVRSPVCEASMRPRPFGRGIEAKAPKTLGEMIVLQ